VFDYLCTACDVKGKGARCWYCRGTRHLKEVSLYSFKSPHHHDPARCDGFLGSAGTIHLPASEMNQPLPLVEAA
jgi:hypothetical protein